MLIEVRQDLISTDTGQRLWAERLAPMFTDVVAATEEPQDG
jgi:predicted N-formylglutamate amidohydrolase